MRPLAAAVLLLTAACGSPGRPLPDVAGEINATRQPTTYRITPGDLLHVQYAHSRDWTHETRVREDGHASFLFLGDVFVAGRTLGDIESQLAQAQRDQGQRQPALVVQVKERPSRIATVFGEVRVPGTIDLNAGSTSLIEAIGKAGGPLKATAKLGSLVLVRFTPTMPTESTPGEPWTPAWTRQAWLIDADYEYWGNPVPVYLQPNDIVFIPNKNIDDVNIWVDQYIRRMVPIPGGFLNQF